MLRTAVICLFVSFFSVSLWSQSGVITGTVQDATHALLPRATVRILTWEGNELSRSLTDSHGRFRFVELDESSYRIEASLTGFQTVAVTARPGEDVELLLPLAPVRESVVVSATRTDVPTAQLGAAVSVIGKDEIVNRQELLASELLQSVPGLTVVRVGGLGNITSLFVRGGESDYNKVLLDGIPLNEPGGTFQFDSLSTENLERLEVVRGPQSALFGSDAMSSVVQLFTQRGSAETRRPHMLVGIEGGKYATWRGRAGISGDLSILDYAMSFEAAMHPATSASRRMPAPSSA
ncbi:MAG: TonB-dependent receptor plug domain-containing protein [Acidobacteria bacterium]|nr:TonB-dependent receptor plug domain-containing protein [Acidobacteriota bacterium]